MIAMTHSPEAGKTEIYAHSSPNVTDGGYLPARHVLDRYRISQMTLWRWLNDEDMGFPKPVYLGRFRYWRAADLLKFEQEQVNRRAA